jgi:peptidoglycan/xylan/chitin deacetylase (PgdA/CDA1 family)
MYHRIAEHRFDPWELTVSPAIFADQLRWLAAHRTVLPLTEFAERQRDRTLPPNAVALTFDDGYSCVAEVAAPMLETAGLPATFFIPAELIERREPFWWDELKILVLGHAGDVLIVRGKAIMLGETRPEDIDWKPGARPSGARQAAYQRIWAALRELPPAELDTAMEGLRDQSSSARMFDGPRPMSPEQVRATASARIQFGSHALTHPWLSSLTTAEKRREIGNSIGRCEELTGDRPMSFAYPYGNFDEESEQLAKAAGFVCACSTVRQSVTAKSRSFALPRVAMTNRSFKQFHRGL